MRQKLWTNWVVSLLEMSYVKKLSLKYTILTLRNVSTINNFRWMALIQNPCLNLESRNGWRSLVSIIANKQNYYYDKHESEDNVKYCEKIMKQYYKHEKNTYQWIHLTESDAIKLEEDSNQQELLKNIFLVLKKMVRECVSIMSILT